MKIVIANVQAYAQPDGTPHAVPSAHPVLEAEHVGLVDAELGDLLLVGRQGDEVLGDVAVALGGLEEPLLGRVGVGGRLGSGKGLGGDEEERRLRLAGAQDLGDVRAVDVGDEVHGEVTLAIWFEGFRDHHRTPGGGVLVSCGYCVWRPVEKGRCLQVRTPNANVHDGFYRLSAVSGPLPTSHLLRELLHVL